MQIDPHTLSQILQRIYKQLRCPQCGKRVPVDFSSVRVFADSAFLLQLKCEECNAYIVLHATVQGLEDEEGAPEVEMANVSTTLDISTDELDMLKGALKDADGSFETLFKQYGKEE